MRTLVLYLPGDPARPAPWALFEAPHATPVQTGAGVPGAEMAADRCWVLVAGTDATAHAVDLPAEATERQLAAAAAFALEDALATDPAALHFALGAPAQEKRLTVVASHAAMAGWNARLSALGIKADLLLPDYLAVAGDPVIHDGLLLMKTPHGGFAAEADLAAIVLEGAPQPVATVSPAAFLAQAYAALLQGAPVNLLQGRYAPRRDWAALMRPWRRAAGLAAGIALAVVVGFGVEGVRLNRQAEAANARAEAVFRAALPQVKRVVNPRAQMRAHLQAASVMGGGFLTLSEIVVGGTSAVTDAEITTLRFDAKRGEIAATFSLPSFEAVERVKTEMAGRGALVQEGGARQDGVRILADMTVRQP